MTADEPTPLRELARSMALALADRSMRVRVGGDMRASMVREHKLELRRYLTTRRGEPLLADMASATGRRTSDVLALLNAVRPLELYMPVPQHRRTWKGDDLLVAALLDERSAPTGFTPRGDQVALDASTPPQVPTLALVPVETDFAAEEQQAAAAVRRPAAAPAAIEPPPDCDPAAIVCDPCDLGCPVPPPPPPPQPAGLYMDQMVIRDAHEPWIRGKPELDLIVWGQVRGAWVPNGIQPTLGYVPGVGNQWNYSQSFVWNPNAVRRVYSACAGEHAADWRYFDFNGNGSNVPRWGTALFAETGEFAIVEAITDPSRDLAVAHKRLVHLTPPIQVEILERDDGHQCPEPPKYYEFEASFRYNFQTHRFSVLGFSFPDFATLFGSNNDRVSIWTFSSLGTLEALNRSFFVGGDADIVLTSRGFRTADLPAEQDPYAP